MIVVLGFYDSNRDVGLVVENVVGPLLSSPCMQLPPHINSSIREANLFTDLCVYVPTGRNETGRDAFGADVAFAEGPLVHGSIGLDWAHEVVRLCLAERIGTQCRI